MPATALIAEYSVVEVLLVTEVGEVFDCARFGRDGADVLGLHFCETGDEVCRLTFEYHEVVGAETAVRTEGHEMVGNMGTVVMLVDVTREIWVGMRCTLGSRMRSRLNDMILSS